MPPSQIKTSNGDSRALDQFIRELDAANEQTRDLLNTVKTTEVDLGSLKTEIRILTENLRDLADIVRGDDGSLSFGTRLVLLERNAERLEKEKDKEIQELKKQIQDLSEKKTSAIEKAETKNSEIALAESSGKWKTYTALGTGLLALLGTVITLLSTYFNR